MKCKNLILITGTSCVGKTPIAVRLSERYGFYIIHTDLLYHPLDREKYKGVVGDDSIEKRGFIRKHKKLMTETTIIEGSHIGNTRELEIFLRELDFNGEVYKFKVETPNHKTYFRKKHKVEVEKKWEEIKKWWDSIYDWDNAIIVENCEDIVNFLGIKNGYICLSGQSQYPRKEVKGF